MSRLHSHDAFVCEEEEGLLQELSAALGLPEADQRRAIEEAEQGLEQHQHLWQVLYGCFGASFDWPLLPG